MMFSDEIVNAVKKTRTFIDKIPRKDTKELCMDLLCSVVEQRRFSECPAAVSHHHAYAGGLDVHTSEVIDNCLKLNAMMGNPFTEERCIVAGFLHDLGKLYVYTVDKEGFVTKDKDQTCSDEAHVFNLCAQVGMALTDEVLSAVEFAHGGWSVQTNGHAKPSRLANLLHCADLLSANFGQVEEPEEVV